MKTRILLVGSVLAGALSAPALAVPIPWKNCGQPTDILSISLSVASVWPPSVAAPASATATFDTAGNLANLRISLLHGVAWTFDTGPLPSTTSGGFVSLPASFPVNVTSPPLPLAAGPYSTTRTFGSHGTPPTTIVSHANVASPIVPPVSTTVSLSFEGKPGFPLTPVAGSAYEFQAQMTEAGGAEVFCMDIVVPLKTATPFVRIQSVSNIPTLSDAGLAALTLMLTGVGLVGTWRRVRMNSHLR